MTEGAFAAIDVEIAAKQAGSICQVGAVVFDDACRPVEGGRRELLVRPPGNRYSPDFFKYHGVKPEDTEDAPTWAEAAAAIHRSLVPLTDACFRNGSPSTIRYVLRQLGVDIGEPRLPVVEPDAATGATVMAEVRRHRLDALALA